MAFRNRIVRLSQLTADSITGALIRTAASGLRWELSSSTVTDSLLGYTGDPSEGQPGHLKVIRNFASGIVGGAVELLAPKFSGTVGGSVNLENSADGASSASMASGGSNDAFVTVTQSLGAIPGAGESLVEIDAQNKVTVKAGPGGIVFQSYAGGGDAPQCFTGNEGGFLKGAAPPAGIPKLIRQGTVVVTVGASGAFSFNYHDSGFPHGLVSLLMSPGDNSVSGLSVVPVLGNCSLTLAYGQAFTGAGAFVSSGAGIRVNYIAIGW